ncbi:LysR family transcriptional regulator [Geminicoccus roseus]|uniref:LysR family transcriptional regulator n=1 Tax=Geminicoccus roseus TaxID=404900 RepID=UPI0003FD64BC|nr:LysR substrate-binding domain-containing protein [Geminicoccus roseus]
MDLRQLRYFIAIVEQGSFSKAALTLHVAQPALSLHVRNMEADLGTPLLFRSPQGVVPTEAGEILLRKARLIVEQFEAVRQEIEGHEAEPSGEVRLGVPGTISQILAVPMITEVRRLYPKIKLRIAEAMSGFVLEWLRENRIDLGILYLPVEDRGLTSRSVLSEELTLFAPAARIGVCTDQPGEGPVAYADVAHLPLILPSPGHGLRQLLEDKATARGLLLNSVIDVDSYGNIKELVEAGLGYSILPTQAIAKEVQAGRLRTWRVENPLLRRTVHLVHPADRPMPNAVAAIEQVCRTTLARLVESGRWDGGQLEGSHYSGDRRTKP